MGPKKIKQTKSGFDQKDIGQAGKQYNISEYNAELMKYRPQPTEFLLCGAFGAPEGRFGGGAVFYLIQRSMQFLVVVDVYKYVLYVEVRYLLQHRVQQTGSDWDIRQGCMSFIFTCHPFAN